eukprot:gene10380-8321_t
MLLLLIQVVAVLRLVSADSENPAPGIKSWCDFSEPSYGQSRNRISAGERGAWACVGKYYSHRGGGGDEDLMATGLFLPTQNTLDTVDRWATDGEQCMVPGPNPMPPFTAGQPENIRPGFPSTFNLDDVCQQYVYQTDLVDKPGRKYGTVYIFKDTEDVLHITVSLYAITDYATSGQLAIVGPKHQISCSSSDGLIGTLRQIIFSAGQEPLLQPGSPVCIDTLTATVLSTTFSDASASQELYRFLTRSYSIMITTFVIATQLPCGSRLLLSASGNTTLPHVQYSCDGQDSIPMPMLCCRMNMLLSPPPPLTLANSVQAPPPSPPPPAPPTQAPAQAQPSSRTPTKLHPIPLASVSTHLPISPEHQPPSYPSVLPPTQDRSPPSKQVPAVYPASSPPQSQVPVTFKPSQAPPTSKPSQESPTSKPSSPPQSQVPVTSEPSQAPPTSKPSQASPTSKPSSPPQSQVPVPTQPSQAPPTSKPSQASPTSKPPPPPQSQAPVKARQFFISAYRSSNVTASNIRRFACPNLRSALLDELHSMGVEVDTAYPLSLATLDGCLKVSKSSRRIFYKVRLYLSLREWKRMMSPEGLVNSRFVSKAKLLCWSVLSFANAQGDLQLRVNSSSLTALSHSSTDSACQESLF